MNIFNLIGRYMLLMGKVFSRPERRSVYKRRVLAEMETLGLNSIGIVTLVSVFMGAVAHASDVHQLRVALHPARAPWATPRAKR